jgi:hypothetical protein
MAHQAAQAVGQQVNWDDDGQDLPEYGDRFDEGRMQLSQPWLRSDHYFRNQIRIVSNHVDNPSLQTWLSAYRPRMQWWFLTPGLRVYGLAMERCRWMDNAILDRTVYPIHPSRYTITTTDTSPLTEDGQENDFGFEWSICLDEVILTLEGGRRILDLPAEARDLPSEAHWNCYRWEVYAEECAPWTLFHRDERPATVFHPDVPAWGPGTLRGPQQPRWTEPRAWFIPPVECIGAHGLCEGAAHAGTVCTHMWWPMRNSRICTPHASHGPVALELGARYRGGPLCERSWNPRSIPVAAHAYRTLWPRGMDPFEVSIPPPQFFNAEARPAAH